MVLTSRMSAAAIIRLVLETISDVRINVDGAALTVPDAVRNATVPPVRVDTERLADGVWLVGGGSHNSVVVEFRDHVAVIEAPLNEERSLAVIEEVMSLVPNKPIRFIVNTHHHWDHLGGLRAYVHEGATVITHESNRPYYQEVLKAGPWLLKPDRFSLYPPEEWSEGYIFETVREKYILGDETRMVEISSRSGPESCSGYVDRVFPKGKTGGGGRPLHTAGARRPVSRHSQCQQPDLLSESAAIEAGRGDDRAHSRTPRSDVRVREFVSRTQ